MSRVIRGTIGGEMTMKFAGSFIATLSGGPLVYDTFTVGDGTLLSAHTPDIDTVGGGWAATDPDLYVNSNALVSTPGVNARHGWIDAGEADVTVSCQFKWTGSNNWVSGLLLRWNQATGVGYQIGQVAWGGGYELWINEMRPGWTKVASVTAGATGVWQELTATISGTTITASLGGVPLVYNSATYGAGVTTHGVVMSTGASTTVTVDDYQIEAAG